MGGGGGYCTINIGLFKYKKVSGDVRNDSLLPRCIFFSGLVLHCLVDDCLCGLVIYFANQCTA